MILEASVSHDSLDLRKHTGFNLAAVMKKWVETTKPASDLKIFEGNF
jgi:hypothetical protein